MSGSKGDLILSLPCVRALGGGVLLIKPNVPRMKYRGQQIMRISSEDAAKFLPLLRSQEYISDARIWDGERIDYDLDKFRETGWKLGRGFIPRHFGLAFDCNLDLVTPWINVNPSDKYASNILWNRTPRYNNPKLRFEFLRRYPTVFIGLPEENHLRLPLCHPADYLELAEYIAGCKAFIGGQSLCMAIAMGLGKVPRWLELSPESCDVIQVHPGAYDVWNQRIFEAQVGGLFQEKT